MYVQCETNSKFKQAADLFNIIKRTDFVVTAAAIAVAAGFLLPMPTCILDVLVIFTLSLAAAALFITVCAGKGCELSGFGLLIVLASGLRILVVAACVRNIFKTGSAGTVIGFFSGIVNTESVIGEILILGALAALAFITMTKTAKSIGRLSLDFTCNIDKARQGRINEDHQSASINNKRLQALRESSFFASMSCAAGFMFAEAVIEAVIIVINIFAGLVMGFASRSAAGITINTYIGLTNGVIIAIQMPALIASLACRYLVQKNYLESTENKEPETCACGNLKIQTGAGKNSLQRINVICSEVNQAQPAMSQYGENKNNEYSTNFSRSADKTQQHPTHARGTNGAFEGTAVSEEFGNLVRSTGRLTAKKADNEQANAKLWLYEQIKDSYPAIAQLIQNRCLNEDKTILMAAADSKILPVTVPINIAIQLAKNGQRCLLIDLDYDRDAVAKVFELYNRILEEKIPPKQTITGIPTNIRNLFVYPAYWLTETAKSKKKLQPSKINQVITNLKNRYDYLIVYSPNINKQDNCELIAECIETAMLFGLKNSNVSDMLEFLNELGCDILEPEHILANAVLVPIL